MDPLHIKKSLNQLKELLDKHPQEFLIQIQNEATENLTVYLKQCKVSVLNICQLTRYKLGLKPMVDLWHHIGLDPYEFCRGIKRHFFLKIDEAEAEDLKVFLKDIHLRHNKLPQSYNSIDLPFYLRTITEHTFYGLLSNLAENPTSKNQLKFNFIWNNYQKELTDILKQEGWIEDTVDIKITEVLKSIILKDELYPTLEENIVKENEIKNIIKIVDYISLQGALVVKEENAKKLKI